MSRCDTHIDAPGLPLLYQWSTVVSSRHWLVLNTLFSELLARPLDRIASAVAVDPLHFLRCVSEKLQDRFTFHTYLLFFMSNRTHGGTPSISTSYTPRSSSDRPLPLDFIQSLMFGFSHRSEHRVFLTTSHMGPDLSRGHAQKDTL